MNYLKRAYFMMRLSNAFVSGRLSDFGSKKSAGNDELVIPNVELRKLKTVP